MAGVLLPDALNGLRGLYDEHLLEDQAQDRYWMHDLVREYSRLLAGEASIAANRLDRLMAHYLRTDADADDLISVDVELFPHPRLEAARRRK